MSTKIKKVQTMLLVTPQTRARADVLALVLGEVRAEVYRMGLENGGLPGLERKHREQIEELDSIAKALGMDRFELAAEARAEGHSLADVRALGTRIAA